MNTILIIVGALVLGGISFALARFAPAGKFGAMQGQDLRDLENAKSEAEKIKEEALNQIKAMKKAMEEEEKSVTESLKSIEELVDQKENIVSRREQRNTDFKKNVEELFEEIKNLESKAEELKLSKIKSLAKIAGSSEEEALKQAKKALESIINDGKEKRIEAELDEFQEDIIRHATAVLQIVIQRLGVPSSVDKNNTSLEIKDEAFKGMLIGKDGVNIKYLESLLPVHVIFNLGGPSQIHVGGVNLLRRNIAKRAISRLEQMAKKEKGINHKMIDEAVKDSEEKIMAICDEKGKWALKQMGLDPERTPKELVNYVGRMYYRTSYGQNIIHHSLEMAYAARLIAELIGTDVNIAMQGAFYHDIGKAIDHDIGGSHDDISKEILEKHGYDEKIVHSAYAHHDKVPCLEPADFIVKAVDAISGGRPGARMESVTNYFERMQELEKCATHFDGVRKVHTMSAGREVRVLVDSNLVKDENMQGLADNIAGKISDEVSFPGIIKVNLLRLSKSTDYAREKSARK